MAWKKYTSNEIILKEMIQQNPRTQEENAMSDKFLVMCKLYNTDIDLSSNSNNWEIKFARFDIEKYKRTGELNILIEWNFTKRKTIISHFDIIKQPRK